MNILINAANQKKGGGFQVAISVIEELKNYPENNYVVICSPQIYNSLKTQSFGPGFEFYRYSFSWRNLISNKFLNGIVKKHNIDKVFTVFGPAYWKPKVPHICGFARGQYIYRDSPFFSLISKKERIKLYLFEKLQLHYFRRADVLITENSDVSDKLGKLLPGKKIYTVTNYYNQVFEDESLWDNNIYLDDFNGITLTTIAVDYPHKNLKIIPWVVRALKEMAPDLKFRFVVTLTPEQFIVEEDIKKHVVFLGNVKIEQCPAIYLKSDIMFLPSLLECFSASYPEAMFMGVPIVTSDLGFARGLCGDAAVYVDPLNPKDIAENILRLTGSPATKKALKSKGKQQLQEYDNYKERVKKFLNIIYETNYPGPQKR